MYYYMKKILLAIFILIAAVPAFAKDERNCWILSAFNIFYCLDTFEEVYEFMINYKENKTVSNYKVRTNLPFLLNFIK